MTAILERERTEVREPTTKTEERPPRLPPARPRLVRWMEWMVIGLGAVFVAVVIAIGINDRFPADPAWVTPEEGQSVLSIGDRQLDPAFVIPQRWVGTSLEGTLEDEIVQLDETYLVQSELAIGARQIDPNAEIPQRWVGNALEGTLEDELADVSAPFEYDWRDDYATRHAPPASLELDWRDDYGTRHAPAASFEYDWRDDYATRHPTV